MRAIARYGYGHCEGAAVKDVARRILGLGSLLLFIGARQDAKTSERWRARKSNCDHDRFGLENHTPQRTQILGTSIT